MKKILFFLGIVFVIGATMVGSSIVLLFAGHLGAIYILVIGLILSAFSNYLGERV